MYNDRRGPPCTVDIEEKTAIKISNFKRAREQNTTHGWACC